MKNLVTLFVNELFGNNFAYINTLINSNDEVMTRDWDAFQNSWNNLCLDQYIGDGGKYRYSGYSVFHHKSTPKITTLKPYEPHYQSLTYNNHNLECCPLQNDDNPNGYRKMLVITFINEDKLS